MRKFDECMSYARFTGSLLEGWASGCLQIIILLCRVRKLVRSLKEDARRRASYTLYLQQSRLSLLRLQVSNEGGITVVGGVR